MSEYQTNTDHHHMVNPNFMGSYKHTPPCMVRHESSQITKTISQIKEIQIKIREVTKGQLEILNNSLKMNYSHGEPYYTDILATTLYTLKCMQCKQCPLIITSNCYSQHYYTTLISHLKNTISYHQTLKLTRIKQ